MSMELLPQVVCRLALVSGLAWTAFNSGEAAVAQEPSATTNTVIEGQQTQEQLANEVDDLKLELEEVRHTAEGAQQEADGLQRELAEVKSKAKTAKMLALSAFCLGTGALGLAASGSSRKKS